MPLIWHVPEASVEIVPEFPRWEKKHGPYVVKLGELIIEFEDEECRTMLHVWFERAGRKVKLSASHTGVSPIEISAYMHARDEQDAGELYSKRPDRVYSGRIEFEESA